MGNAFQSVRSFHDKTTTCTLTSAIEQYERHLIAAGYATSTIYTYRKCLEGLVVSLGEIPINRIDAAIIEEAVLNMLSTNGSGSYAPATANRIRSTLRSFFAWCVMSDLIAESPASGLRLQKSTSSPTASFHPEELNTFFRVIRQSDDPQALRDEALFGIYVCTGMRRTEALRLKAWDYDQVQQLLRIRRGKTGEHERLPAPNQLVGILNEYIRHEKIDGDSYLFPGYVRGAPLSSRQVQARFEKWKSLAALRPDLTIHSFRVSFASLVYRESRDLLLVSRALGHKDVRTTDRYVRLAEGAIREVLEKVFGEEVSPLG